MTRDTQALSVIVPAYNECDGLQGTIERLLATLGAMDLAAYEVLIVDDGSTDDTGQLARRFADQEGAVHLIEHPVNRGYGAALKSGILYAEHPVIAITDADGTYPNQRLPDLLAQLSPRVDMVVGARTGEQVHIPLIRRPAKWVLRGLANMVAARPIPDINSGLRLFRRDAVRRFFTILPDGFSFTTTITLAMLTNGYRVEYVPINYHPRVGTSKIRPIRDTLNFMQLVARIALYFVPLKIFLPLSGLLMLLAVGWALFSWLVLGKLADVSTLVIAMSGLQTGMVGLLAELINKRLPNTFRDE